MTTAAEAREALDRGGHTLPLSAYADLMAFIDAADQALKNGDRFADKALEYAQKANDVADKYAKQSEENATLRTLLKEAGEALGPLMGHFQELVEKEVGNYHYDAGVFVSFQQAEAIADKIKAVTG